MVEKDTVAVQHGVPLGVGLLFGGGVAVWSYFEAQSAVKVRPRLNDVGFIDAFLTSHGIDWLYLHAPVATAVVQVLGLAIVMWLWVRIGI